MGLLDPPALSKAQADARYAQVASLPSRPALNPTNANPSYWAHRGGAYVFPEETADAYAGCYAAGIVCLDADCQPLGDGTLALVHDGTVDRTTNGTGNVSAFTVPTWLTLNAAAKFPWGKITTPSLLGDLIARYSSSTYLSVEPKDASTLTSMLNLADRAGAQASLIVNTSVVDSLQAAKARGYKTYFYWQNDGTGTNADGVGGTVVTLSAALTSGATVTSIPVNALPASVTTGKVLYFLNGQSATTSGTAAPGATSISVTSFTPSSTIASGALVGVGTIPVSFAAGYGADYLGCSGINQTASIPALVATGIPLLPYELNRRKDKVVALAQGVAGFLTDQPVYLAGSTAITTQDSWRYGVLGHGITMWPGTYANIQYVDVNGGALVLTGLAGNNQYVNIGEVSPIAKAATSYQIDIDAAVDATPDTAVLVSFAFPDDGAYNLADGTSTGSPHPASGYMAYMRPTGVASIFKMNNLGVSYSKIGVDMQTPAPVANGLMHYKINVTPTTVSYARTDTAAATLSAGLTSGVAITSLPVNALAQGVSSGAQFLLPTGQIATASAGVAAAATAIPIASLTPSSAVASGASLYGAISVADTTSRGGYMGVGRTGGTATRLVRFKNLVIT